jgi:hypothetical protein
MDAGMDVPSTLLIFLVMLPPNRGGHVAFFELGSNPLSTDEASVMANQSNPTPTPTQADYRRATQLLDRVALVELLLYLEAQSFREALDAFDGDDTALLEELNRRAAIIRDEILQATRLH